MLKIEKPKLIKLDTKRKEAIEKYISLQEDFLKLAKKGICKYLIINYINSELDIDNLTETQKTKLDNIKDERTRELFVKDLPYIDRAYKYLYITPYGIGDEVNREDLTIDRVETYLIESINENIEKRLELYKDFIS